ncbi:MAG: VCBS repeat-containing protein [Clostridia bacterium]|nr:VCBS repeat-containing protein [Clostridia bacterium]
MQIHKVLRVVLLIIPLLGLVHTAGSGRQATDDFAAFREKRMQLPARQEAASPAAGRKHMFLGDGAEEVKVPAALLPGSPLSKDNTGQPVFSAAAVEAVMAKLGLEFRTATIAGWDKEKEALFFRKAYKVYAPPRSVGGCNLVKEESFDLDGDGLAEKYALEQGRLVVSGAAGLIWQTPQEWWVEDFALGDASNDGRPDLNLSVWKEGSFGPYRPFWVAEEDRSVKNHLFIFNLVGGSFKPLWQSSNLARPNYRIALADIEGDGNSELLALEGHYASPWLRQVNLWRWNGWGFTCLTGL